LRVHQKGERRGEGRARRHRLKKNPHPLGIQERLGVSRRMWKSADRAEKVIIKRWTFPRSESDRKKRRRRASTKARSCVKCLRTEQNFDDVRGGSQPKKKKKKKTPRVKSEKSGCGVTFVQKAGKWRRDDSGPAHSLLLEERAVDKTRVSAISGEGGEEKTRIKRPVGADRAENYVTKGSNDWWTRIII